MAGSDEDVEEGLIHLSLQEVAGVTGISLDEIENMVGRQDEATKAALDLSDIEAAALEVWAHREGRTVRQLVTQLVRTNLPEDCKDKG